MDPYPLFLNSVPLEELGDEDLHDFTAGLAMATRLSVDRCEPVSQTECWVRHWARAESERQRRGFDTVSLMEWVN